MNTIQRLLSNTLMAFISNTIAKVSGSILFIIIGRLIGPEEAGIFSLGITYYTILMALSTFGLHDLLVREVAPRREQSGRFVVNFLAMRLAISLFLYAGLLIFLRLILPYDEETKMVLLIISLTIFPEAIFSLLQALFVAYEQLAVPTLAAVVNSIIRLGFGAWLLYNGAGAVEVAWVLPISTTLSLLVFLPSLPPLFRQIPQAVSMRLSWQFCRLQLRQTSGFVLLQLFQTLNFHLDTFIISLLLTSAAIGFYTASQTILFAFMMIPVAVRMGLYPLMARYQLEDQKKLRRLYHKSSQYLIIIGLPIAAGVTLLAQPIIFLVFGESFGPAVLALQIGIWMVPFSLLNVPNARMLLVHGKQSTASWIRGAAMLVSVSLNFLLIPRLGIYGSSIASVLAIIAFFVGLYIYVQRNLLKDNILPLAIKPMIATVVMTLVVWFLRDTFLLLPIAAGALVYVGLIVLLRTFTAEDRSYLRQLVNVKTS